MGASGKRSTQAWLRLAAALRASRRWDELAEAIEAARTAAVHASDFALFGEFLGRLERYEEACSAYDQALASDPDNPRYLFNRAAVRCVQASLEALTETSRALAMLATHHRGLREEMERTYREEILTLRREALELKDIRTHWAEWRVGAHAGFQPFHAAGGRRVSQHNFPCPRNTDVRRDCARRQG